MININLYGAAKDIVGAAEITLQQEFITVQELAQYLTSLYPSLEAILPISTLILDSHPVKITDSLPISRDFNFEILPPFSGG